ncbi:MAG: zinc ribbon domain-containing protein [Betaproteobacteria bacterium]
MTSPVHYSSCPKCGHASLPQDQSLPAACPACGLILAKFGATVSRVEHDRATEFTDEENPARRTFVQLREAVRYIPPRIDPATWWARATLLLLLGPWGLRLMWMDHRDGQLFTSFLHGPLLVFHEAGHVIFRLFGEFMMVAGGTLAQLLMPAIMCGALLLKNRDPFAAAIGLWLFGVSVLDVAPYMYDALHPQLTLLNGSTGEQGGHDWMYLLGETGLIKRAQGLGWLTHKLGAAIVLLSLYWAGWVLWQQKLRLQAAQTEQAEQVDI